MSFNETYQAEVLQSRRTRSQRALFWAKVVSFGLMITVAVVLRSEPELRRALVSAGMDAVAAVTGRQAPTSDIQMAQAPSNPAIPQLSQTPDLSQLQAIMTQAQKSQLGAPVETAARARPRDAVRVNRFGTGQPSTPRFQSVPQITQAATSGTPQEDAATAIAVDLSRLLQAMKPGQ